MNAGCLRFPLGVRGFTFSSETKVGTTRELNKVPIFWDTFFITPLKRTEILLPPSPVWLSLRAMKPSIKHEKCSHLWLAFLQKSKEDPDTVFKTTS